MSEDEYETMMGDGLFRHLELVALKRRHPSGFSSSLSDLQTRRHKRVRAHHNQLAHAASRWLAIRQKWTHKNPHPNTIVDALVSVAGTLLTGANVSSLCSPIDFKWAAAGGSSKLQFVSKSDVIALGRSDSLVGGSKSAAAKLSNEVKYRDETSEDEDQDSEMRSSQPHDVAPIL